MGRMIDRVNIYAVLREACKSITGIDTVGSIIKDEEVR
jgi:hypothetical protein